MFNKKQLSEEEKAELFRFVEEACDLGYEKFESIKSSLPGYRQKLIAFCSLPETDLHARYRQILVEPAKKKKQARLAEKIRDQMRQERSNFIDEHNIDQSSRESAKYKLISSKSYRDHLTWEIECILHLAIPFEYMSWRKARFAGSVLVYSSKTPELFDELLAKVPKYNGTPEVYSNKE